MPPIRFGEFELDMQTLELRKDGALLRLQQQPAKVLALLATRQGALVTREQIRLAIWGDETFVDFDRGLNFCIRQIRIALSDDADNPRYIETLPRLGYRFLGEIAAVREQESSPAKQRVRIGVIPIEDLSEMPEKYFAHGLTEDMITALSRIDPQRLRITVGPKLASEEGYEEIDRVKRQLRLDYLLKGTVQRTAEKLRIGTQLLDLRDKSVLWSETYDFKSSDLFEIQQEVTQRVSKSLALELLPGIGGGTRRYSHSEAAYDAYLKGRYFWHKMSEESVRLSIFYFNEALGLDATFAPAYAGLADCYAQMGSIRIGMMKPSDALAKARDYLQKALELDDAMAEAHCTLALIKSWYEYDWEGAEREFSAALAIEPNHVTALLWRSLHYSVLGKHEDAIASVERAREVDPLSPGVNLYLGTVRAHAGQYDLSLRQIQQSIEIDPSYYRSHMFLGRNLSWLGRHDEAIASYERALSLAPWSFEVLAMMGSAFASKGDRKRALGLLKRVRAAGKHAAPAIMIAQIHAALGEADEMFLWMRRAVKQQSVPVYIVLIHEEFRRYRSDSRYREFLRSIGLEHLSRT